MRGREAGLSILALIIILLALLQLSPVQPTPQPAVGLKTAMTTGARGPRSSSDGPATPSSETPVGAPEETPDVTPEERALGPKDVEPASGSRWSGADTEAGPSTAELGESACLTLNLMVSRKSWSLSYARLRVRPWRARRATPRSWTLKARDADGREANQAFPVRGLLPHGHEEAGELVLGDEHLQEAVPVIVRLPGLRLPVSLELTTPEGQTLQVRVLRELGEQGR